MNARLSAVVLVLLLGIGSRVSAADLEGRCATPWVAQRTEGRPALGGPVLAAPPGVLGDRRQFVVRLPVERIEAQLVALSQHAEAWVDLRWRHLLPADRLRSLLDEFDQRIYPRVRERLGSEWFPGVDGNPRILLLFHDVEANESAQGFGGYFSDRDEDPLLPDSNAQEMLYLDIFALRDYEPLRLYGLLAHEFAHMISWYQHGGRFDERWLEEGRATFVPWDLYGIVPTRFVAEYLHDPARSLTTADEPASWYGGSFLLMLYLFEQFGGNQILRDLTQTSHRGMSAIAQALEADRFGTTLTGWALANRVQDRQAHPRLGYRGLPPRFRVFDAAVERLDDLLRGRTFPLAEWGVRYVETAAPAAGALTLRLKADRPDRLLGAVWRPTRRTWTPFRQEQEGLVVPIEDAQIDEPLLIVISSALAQRVRLIGVPEPFPPADGPPNPVPRALPSGRAVWLREPTTELPPVGDYRPTEVLRTALVAHHLTGDQETLWMAARNGLIRFDRRDPQALTPVEWIPLPSTPTRLAFDGTRLAVALGEEGLQLRSADGRKLRAWYRAATSIRDVALRGPFLLALLDEGGVLVLRDAGNRLVLEGRTAGGVGMGLALDADRMVVADDRFGLRLFPLAQLPRLNPLATVQRPLVGIALVGDWIWGGASELYGVPIGAGPEPVPVELSTVGPVAAVLAGEGGQLIVAEQEGGLRVVDASRPRQAHTTTRFLTPGRPIAALHVGESLIVLERAGGLLTFVWDGRSDPRFLSRTAFRFRPRGLIDPETAVGAGGVLELRPGPDRQARPALWELSSPTNAGLQLEKTLLVATDRGLVRLVPGTAPEILDPWNEPGTDLARSPGGTTLAAAAGALHLYRMVADRPVRTRSIPIEDRAAQLAWIGERLFVGTADGPIRFYRVADPDRAELEGALPTRGVRALAADSERLWAVTAGELVVYIQDGPGPPRELDRVRLDFEGRALALLPDGVLVGGAERLERWQLVDNRLERLEPIAFPAEVIALSARGAALTVATWNGLFRYYRSAEGGRFVQDPPSAQEQRAQPELRFQIGPAYPNPFPDRVVFPFWLGGRARVIVEVFDLDGSRVRRIEGGLRDPGDYSTPGRAVRWDGRNQHGERVAAGVYVYRHRIQPVDGTAPIQRSGRLLYAPGAYSSGGANRSAPR